MGRADFLRPGSWNICCDRCGRKRKFEDVRKTWDGLWVCHEHWEPRQPQDFARALRENQAPPFISKCEGYFLSRPDPPHLVDATAGSLVLASSPPDVDVSLTLVSGPYAVGYEEGLNLTADVEPSWILSFLPPEGISLVCNLDDASLPVTTAYVSYGFTEAVDLCADLDSGSLIVTTAYVTYPLTEAVDICADLDSGSLDITAGYTTYLHDKDLGVDLCCDLVEGSLTP